MPFLSFVIDSRHNERASSGLSTSPTELLGAVGKLTLDEACALAKKALATVAQGADPATD